MKRFDEILTEKIKEAFRDYNADHLADKGWESFKARRKRRSPGLFIIPLWAKAASLLLIISAGTILTYRTLNRQNDNKPAITASQSILVDSVGKTPADSISAGLMAEAEQQMFQAATEKPEKPAGEKILFLKEKAEKTKDEIIVSHLDTDLNKAIDYVHEEPVSAFANTILRGKAHTEKLQTDTLIQNLLANEALNNLNNEDTVQVEEEKSDDYKSKSSFLAGLSGMMAVIDNTLAGAPGVSAGIYYEYRFSRRIAIRPGLAIAMHSSPLENNSGRSDMNYAVPLYDGTSGNTESYDARMNLVALEVPLNMVFNVFSKDKSTLFLSAGASTLICLSQKFIGTFVNSYSKLSTNAMTGESMSFTSYSTLEVEKKEGAFSHADYFGLANLSAGYSLPFGKGSMLIEPYLQMPLGSITSLKVKIFYSGISAKVRFGK